MQSSPATGPEVQMFSEPSSITSSGQTSILQSGQLGVSPKSNRANSIKKEARKLLSAGIQNADEKSGGDPRVLSLQKMPLRKLPSPAIRPQESSLLTKQLQAASSQNMSSQSISQPLAHLQQSQIEQRQRFWSRQTNSAPIANTARARAEHNKTFYQNQLSGKEELRVLHILPGRGSSQLHLTFAPESLDDAEGTYEALSYCWGPGLDMAQVTVNATPAFRVSKHLERALLRLRLPRTERRVWIDAISINQASLLEMNHQVPLMGEIYRRARRTIIWVCDFGDTESKPTCMRTHAAEDDPENDYTLCALPGGSALEHDDVDHKLQRLLQPFHEQLELQCSGNVWWKRLWCVQEFHFSKKLPSVYIGQHAIGWTHFAGIFKSVVGSSGPLTLFDKLRKTEQRTMHDLVCTTGSFKCSDPRDRIYALLNMTGDHEAKVSPNYANSILETLEEVVMYCILESRSVDVLLDQRIDRSRGEAYGQGVLPTWVPDFTRLQPLSMTRGKDTYCAGGGIPDVQLCEDELQNEAINVAPGTTSPRLLKMKAVAFDRIAHHTTLSDIPQHESSPSGCLIYNSLQHPGQLIQSILEALHFRFEEDMM